MNNAQKKLDKYLYKIEKKLKGFTPEAKVSIIQEIKSHLNDKIIDLKKKGIEFNDELVDKIIKENGTPNEVAKTFSAECSLDKLGKYVLYFYLILNLISIYVVYYYSKIENISFNFKFLFILIIIASLIDILLLISILTKFEKFRNFLFITAILSLIIGFFNSYFLTLITTKSNSYVTIGWIEKLYNETKYQILITAFLSILVALFVYHGYLHLVRDSLDGVVKKRYYYFKIIPFIGILEIVLAIYIYYFLYEAINKIEILFNNLALIVAPILLSCGIFLIYINIIYFRNPTKLLGFKKRILVFGLASLILCSSIFYGFGSKEFQVSDVQEIPEEKWYVYLEKTLMDLDGNFYYVFLKDRILLIEKYDNNYEELLNKAEILVNYDNNYIYWYIEDAKIDSENNINIVVYSLDEMGRSHYYESEKIETKYYFLKISNNLKLIMKKDITNFIKYGNLYKLFSENKMIEYNREVNLEFNMNKTFFICRTIISEVNNKENEFLIERVEFINDEYISNISYFNISNNFSTDYYHWINPSNSVDGNLHFLFSRKDNLSIEYMVFSNNGTLLYSKIIGKLYYGGIISFTTDFDGNPVAFFTNYDKENKSYSLNFLKYENNKITFKNIFEDDKLSAGSDIKVSLDSENNFRIIRVHSPKRKEWKIVEYPLHTILYYKINSRGEVLQSTNISIGKNSKTYNEYGKKLYISSFYKLFLDEKNNMYIIYRTKMEKEKHGGNYNEEINNKDFIKIDNEGNIIYYKNLTQIIKISNPLFFIISIFSGIFISILIIFFMIKKNKKKIQLIKKMKINHKKID